MSSVPIQDIEPFDRGSFILLTLFAPPLLYFVFLALLGGFSFSFSCFLLFPYCFPFPFLAVLWIKHRQTHRTSSLPPTPPQPSPSPTLDTTSTITINLIKRSWVRTSIIGRGRGEIYHRSSTASAVTITKSLRHDMAASPFIFFYFPRFRIGVPGTYTSPLLSSFGGTIQQQQQ